MRADKQPPSPASSRPPTWKGLACMVTASLLFSMMNACVYAVGVCEPQLPSAMVSFVRILINLIIVATPALLAGKFQDLFGDRSPSLWLRGVFGSLALMLSFGSIQMIGPGESAFLAATSGVFVAILGPFVLRQKNTALVWVAIVGALAGVGLLFQPRYESGNLLGRAMGLCTGVLAALAYLMVARAGRKNSTESVIFYFCLVGVFIHLAYFGRYGFRLPMSLDAWILLLLGGGSASIAQFYMTRAYQIAPAALVSAVAYLTPVLSLGWGVALFSRVPDAHSLAGCVLVLVFGVTLPFLNAVDKR